MNKRFICVRKHEQLIEWVDKNKIVSIWNNRCDNFYGITLDNREQIFIKKEMYEKLIKELSNE